MTRIEGQTAADKPFARKAYVPAVKWMMPGCTGKALATRCQLMLIRDIASMHWFIYPDATDMERKVAESVWGWSNRYALTPMRDELLAEGYRRILGLFRFLKGLDCENVREFWDEIDRELRVLQAMLT